MIDDDGYDDWVESNGSEEFKKFTDDLHKKEVRDKQVKILKEAVQLLVDETYQGMSERAKQGIIDANIALIDAITERD